MSQEERDELNWLKQAEEGKITQREAAERMGVSDRWVRKLLRRMKREGDAGSGARITGKAVESQASGSHAQTGSDGSETAGMARFRSDLCS